MPYPKLQGALDRLLSETIEKYGQLAVEAMVERALMGGPDAVEPAVLPKVESPDQASKDIDKVRGRE